MSNSTEQSKAHRLFFAKATSRGVFDLLYSDYWDNILGESGANVLRRFISEGLIAPAPIKDVIDNRFTVEQLKPHLKERGLKVSGKKFELLERIIAADPAWAQEQTKDGMLYYRTREGRTLADEIYTAIGTESGEMEARIVGLIHDEKYEEAYRTWAVWDAEQIFPRDEWLGVDNTQNVDTAFVQMARRLAAKLPAGERERVIMNVLYGKASYEPQELEARHGSAYERDLMDWRRKGFVAGLQIKPAGNNSCSGACNVAGCYRLEDAPDYPFKVCTGEFCNCWWSPVFEDEQPTGGWKVPEKRHPHAGGRIMETHTPFKEITSAPVVCAKNAGVVIQADSKPEDTMDLPISVARRVMENKVFGLALVVALLVAVTLILKLA